MNNTILLPNTACFAQNNRVKFKRRFQEKLLFSRNPKYKEPVSFVISSNFFDITQYICLSPAVYWEYFNSMCKIKVM